MYGIMDRGNESIGQTLDSVFDSLEAARPTNRQCVLDMLCRNNKCRVREVRNGSIVSDAGPIAFGGNFGVDEGDTIGSGFRGLRAVRRIAKPNSSA